jgi:ribosomal protein L15
VKIRGEWAREESHPMEKSWLRGRKKYTRHKHLKHKGFGRCGGWGNKGVEKQLTLMENPSE